MCLITPEYIPITGGTGTYVYYLANMLANYGNMVYIVTKNNQDCKKKKQKESLRRIYAFQLKTLKAPLLEQIIFYKRASKKMMEIRSKFPINIAHVNLPLTSSFAVPNNFDGALVATVHTTWKGENDALKHEPFFRLNTNEKIIRSFNNVLRFFEYKLLRRSDKIIAVSEYTKKELLEEYQLKANKIKVIYNGVDIDRFRPADNKKRIKQELGLNNDTIILYVGRLYSRKGIPILLKAAPFILRKFRNVKFVISGKGLRNEKKLKAFADNLKVRDHTLFVGYFPDEKLPKLYQAADIFVLPSMYEGMPFTILEALSSALPVVTTKVGGIPEVIEDGKNGLLIKPLDFLGLADKILFLLENPSFASEMGLSGRRIVEEKFNWQNMARQVLEIYNEVLAK
ncbi:MAG: glycosyltransferase family 4 protein [Candidatus Bathyarchaeia archaeon]